MGDISNHISDVNDLAWPGEKCGLLPRSLLKLWGSEELPAWVCDEVGVPQGGHLEALEKKPWLRKGPLSERLQNFAVFLVQSRRDAIGPVPAVSAVWPPSLDHADVPWKRRTRNCLLNAGLHRRLIDLSQVTFEILFAVPGMGPHSILDFACTLEAVLDHLGQSPPTDRSAKEEVSLNPAVLLDVVDERWADWVSEEDPRFRDVLPAGKGTLTERVDQLTATPESTTKGIAALADSVAGVREMVATIETMALEAALRDYLGKVSRVSGPHLDALTARMHWDGKASPMTLEDAGAMVGVTRERIRQIQERTVKRLPSHPVVMPALDKALDLLGQNPSTDVATAAALLQRAGITYTPFHPASLLQVARDCGRSPILQIATIRGRSTIEVDSSVQGAELLVRVAHAQTRTSGVSNLAQVLAEAASRGADPVSEELLKGILQRYADAEFLTDEWFWCPKRGDDGLRTLSRKMLSVTSPIDVASMREGVRRAFRFRSISGRGRARIAIVPPRDALAAYYQAHPEFVLGEAGTVRTVRALDYRAELVGVEQTIIRVLQASPTNMLDRPALLEGCVELGVNPSTLWTILSYSPVVQRIAPGLWAPRGVHVNPAIVEAVRSANALRPREKRVMDYGWTSDGLLWIAVRLPKAFEVSMFGVPAAVRRFVEGRDFQAHTEHGDECGRIRVYDGGSFTGHAEYLRRSGADEGDLLKVSFDISGGGVTLELLDDEALDELSPVV